MASNIDVNVPATGKAYTQKVRDNFAAAKAEIEALQAGLGSIFSTDVTLPNGVGLVSDAGGRLATGVGGDTWWAEAGDGVATGFGVWGNSVTHAGLLLGIYRYNGGPSIFEVDHTGHVTAYGTSEVDSKCSFRVISEGANLAYFAMYTDAAVGGQRWALTKNDTAEGGANAGSDFELRRYTDAGAYVDSPIWVTRSNGNVGIGATSPDEKLDVSGYLVFDPPASGWIKTDGRGILLYQGDEIEWLTSIASGGYGFRIYGNDPGGGTLLNIAVRSASAAWEFDHIRIRDSGRTDFYNPNVNGQPLVVTDGVTTLEVKPNSGAGGSNPIVQAGDIAIIASDGAIDTGELVIAPWATDPIGIRLDGLNDTVNIYGTTVIRHTNTDNLGATFRSEGSGTFSVFELKSLVTNGSVFMDWQVAGGDADYDFRLIRATGANGITSLIAKGTGGIKIGSLSSGFVVGSPTGGDQGFGTINATEYYKNGAVLDLSINPGLICSNWTEWAAPTVSPKNVSLNGCAYGSDSTFTGYVAVGYEDVTDAYMVHSVDGSRWLENTNPKNFRLYDVIYSSNLWVAVGGPDGTDAYIITAPDPTTVWTEKSNPKNVALWRVVFNGAIYVAVGLADGTDAYIISSTNASTWTERSNPKNFNLYGVAWNGSVFCAVGAADGTDAYIITSPIGITWTERSNPKNVTLYDIAWSPTLSLFCAVGQFDGTDSYIVTSPDGTTWTERSNPKNRTLLSIVWSDELGVFLAAAGGSLATDQPTYMISSPDGVNWTERRVIGNNGNGSGGINELIWDGTRFLAVGNSDGTDALVLTSASI